MKEKLGEILRSKLYNDGVKIISHLLNTLITHKYIYNKLKCKSYLTEKTQSCQKSIINMKLCTLFSPDRHQRQRSVGSVCGWDRWWQCTSVVTLTLMGLRDTSGAAREQQVWQQSINHHNNRTSEAEFCWVLCSVKYPESWLCLIPCDHFRTIHCFIKPPTTEAGIWRERSIKLPSGDTGHGPSCPRSSAVPAEGNCFLERNL